MLEELKKEVMEDYEKNTGLIIIDTIESQRFNPLEIPGILVGSHGPFTWGINPSDAVYHAVVVETIAEMAIKTMFLNSSASISRWILDKHYLRKHGKDAYYGQI